MVFPEYGDVLENLLTWIVYSSSPHKFSEVRLQMMARSSPMFFISPFGTAPKSFDFLSVYTSVGINEIVPVIDFEML